MGLYSIFALRKCFLHHLEKIAYMCMVLLADGYQLVKEAS